MSTASLHVVEEVIDPGISRPQSGSRGRSLCGKPGYTDLRKLNRNPLRERNPGTNALTLCPSPRGRGNHKSAPALLPLPLGEGRGEGTNDANSLSCGAICMIALPNFEIPCACFDVSASVNKKDQRYRTKLVAVSALLHSATDMDVRVRWETAATIPNIEIVADSLGKPHLLIDGSEGPAVSFAYEGDTMWVAAGPKGSSIGIDAAHSGSFRGNYPFHRVFHVRELELGTEKQEVAALVWSAKEAVVKALGCGFHLVDPLHVNVELWYTDYEDLLLKVRLADRARQRLGLRTGDAITVRSLRYENMWVSAALLD